jgi:hypothetical protein
MSQNMSTTIRIPRDLDRNAVMGVLKQLNLLETGATSFGPKEISAALKWARVAPSESHRFLNAVGQHALFREPDPVPRRIPWRGPRHILCKT